MQLQRALGLVLRDLQPGVVHRDLKDHLELVEPCPRPRLGDQLPQDDTEAEDVALGRDPPQPISEALRSPDARMQRWSEVGESDTSEDQSDDQELSHSTSSHSHIFTCLSP